MNSDQPAALNRINGTKRRVAILAAVLLAVLMSCASTPHSPGPDRTAGISLELYVKKPGHAYSLFRVGTDGSLSHGGAQEATFGKTTWTGSLTDDEISRLLTLLEHHGWFERLPESASPEEGEAGYEIKLRRAGRSVTMKARGPNEHVEPIHELLDDAARRRFEPILQSLPLPGEQK